MNKYTEISQFYDKLEFPGKYSIEDLNFFKNEIKNVYLSGINNFLDNNMQVLDVGAGTGLITNLFAKKYPKSQFTAIDFSSSIYYGELFSKDNAIINTTWVHKNFLEFDTSKKFDVIICQGVLHHIPDWMVALEKIKNLLSPSGILLLGLYHPWGKFLQKILPVDYKSFILEHDQCNNPFELTFTQSKISSYLSDMSLIAKYPSSTINIKHSFIASGGLILYAFKGKL
jgi:SAM-dependent methyltransferase